MRYGLFGYLLLLLVVVFFLVIYLANMYGVKNYSSNQASKEIKNIYNDGNIEVVIPENFQLNKFTKQIYRINRLTDPKEEISIDIQPLIEDTSETYIQKRKAQQVGNNLYVAQEGKYLEYVYIINTGTIVLIYAENTPSLAEDLKTVAFSFKYLK